MDNKIEIIPNQDIRGRPLFKTPDEQRAFEERFAERVRPLLEECDERRRRSWESIQNKIYY